MKPNITWGLQKIQAHGIADNTIYATEGTQIIFIVTSPWIPVFKVNDDVKIALTLTRHEEAWWIINQSTEYCCTVNDQIIEPYHRMRLNEGDLIEWGLSSWRLVRGNPPPPVPRAEKTTSQTAASPETMTEYLDLDWFRQQQRTSQNPFDIIPAHGTSSAGGDPETENPLTRLYQEYREALLSPGQDIQRQADPFPFNGEAATQDLASLRDPTAEAGTLQDMVTGGLSIDAILDVLDATGEGETAWPAEKTPPDILHLLSPEYTPETAHNTVLPDLTRKEHRIIGIDSHYRINPAQHGDITHDKQ
ncbi:type VI secretion system-associated protein TagK [Escherichia coli]|uniref:type VI secretion system-associated protein TagK n=1 Tax=Escherichia coli TaxID=562 RepID=UPI0017B7A871|nr:type VI secretion system-associated protein TagK [Escherichia coli]EKQ3320869.1 type VI secretion system-associated protein TagK [Escherichia coli]EKR5238383.1 type VI secretion system-associated protein TagK [Escherichia coli]EKS5474634.1 type VI secretion system-associated protein TagK [Escherichia coli]ELO4795619.1 type VI secretion system-associated protein TagK [Escherichia coli]